MTTFLELAPRPSRPLAQGQEYDVFISYRSVHRAWAIQLYDVLTQLGYVVFLDQFVLAAGHQLIDGLERALSASAAGILVWSESTRDSEWVWKEYRTMEALRSRGQFRYVVCTLDGTQPPLFAASSIWIDFSEAREGPRGSGLLRLLFGLHGKPLTQEAVRLASSVDEATRDAVDRVRGARMNGNVELLRTLAESQDTAWTSTQLLRCEAAEALIALRRNVEAIEILKQLSQDFAKSLRPKQLLALAHARAGNLTESQNILGTLYAAGERDPETLGLYGRTWMDRYALEPRREYLERSRNLYREAADLSPDNYYTAINAAAKSMLLGDDSTARLYAEKTAAILDGGSPPKDYWGLATRGEVHLLLREYESAGARYAEAIASSPDEVGSHESTLRQAERLLRAMGATEDQVSVVTTALRRSVARGT